MSVNIEGWFSEKHEGVACRFLCVHTAHFGFALSDRQAETLVPRLSVLLETGQCLTDKDSVLHVDWSHGDGESVMIAFRPDGDCQGRYYDFPREATVELLEKLKERLRVPDHLPTAGKPYPAKVVDR
jgi:hypothetical protein